VLDVTDGVTDTVKDIGGSVKEVVGVGGVPVAKLGVVVIDLEYEGVIIDGVGVCCGCTVHTVVDLYDVTGAVEGPPGTPVVPNGPVVVSGIGPVVITA
jgi:hypothetical protein